MTKTLRLLVFLLLMVAFSWPLDQTAAQGAGSILLRVPRTDSFPAIRLYFDAYDAQNKPIQGLTPANIQVVENGRSLQARHIETMQNGLQVILVWNNGAALAVKTDGLTEMERIRQAMQTWAAAQPPSGLDQYNLATPDGMALVDSESAQSLIDALGQIPAEPGSGQPSLTSLAEALDLATDPLEDPLMKRVILYITPPIPEATAESLTDLAERARETGARVHIWQIGPAVDPGAAQPLEQIALETGGQFFPISPVDALPEIEPLFGPIRQMYLLEYQSEIRASGTQKISIQVNLDGEQLASNEQSFDMAVTPPNPIFLDPPSSIERGWKISDQANSKPALVPNQVELRVLVEYPDQHVRPLAATRLFVDGRVVAENLTEPFDRFIWDISGETITAPHSLRVEAVDSLGLSGMSAETPIDLVVAQPAQTNLTDRISGSGALVIIAMIISGAALAVVLSLTSTRRRGRWKRRRPDRKTSTDPLTQPVSVTPLPARKNKTTPIAEILNPEPEAQRPAAWPRPSTINSPARLIILDENEQPVTGGVITLARHEITFGSDPQRATQVLASPTVDALHARLSRGEDGGFLLADQNSVAGTWVNFAPVHSRGARLEHGDLIHIGKAAFRFELTDPTHVPASQIIVTELDKPL